MIAGFQTFNDWYVNQDTFFHSLQGLRLRMRDTVQIICHIFAIVRLSRIENKNQSGKHSSNIPVLANDLNVGSDPHASTL